MSEQRGVWVTLRDRQGNRVTSLRLGWRLFQPLILQWGAKYYLRHAGESDYRETECLFVTLESQCPQTAEEKKRAHLEPGQW